MTVAVQTLGCKINRCDTENLVSNLVERGLKICNFSEKADIYIINTCTVTHVSDKKSLQMIRRAKRQNPFAYVAVCGCLVQKGVPNDFPADFIFDARKPDVFFECLKSVTSIEQSESVSVLGRTRAFIKIQDGCEQFCAYCIVPYVRGPSISRKRSEILGDVRKQLKIGANEIVLTGIHASSYNDAGDFASLLEDVLSIDGLTRLRLSSVDPRVVDKVFLGIISKFDNLCPHFHLSLQSGSNEILKRMNRKYTTEEYMEIVKNIRKVRPNAAITTDVIVGFPGESEKCFVDTYSFAQAVGFSDMHIFEYSKRDGTIAAIFDEQVPAGVKKQRSKRLRSLAVTMRAAYLEKQIGQTLQVLFEKDSESGLSEGLCMEYVRTVVSSREPLVNIVKDIKITGVTNEGLIGEIHKYSQKGDEHERKQQRNC